MELQCYECGKRFARSLKHSAKLWVDKLECGCPDCDSYNIEPVEHDFVLRKYMLSSMGDFTPEKEK